MSTYILFAMERSEKLPTHFNVPSFDFKALILSVYVSLPSSMATASATEVPRVAVSSIPRHKCNHEPQFVVLPPSIEFLTQEHSDTAPNLLLDRTIPRCKLCDLCDAREMFDLLKMPDEAYHNIAPEMFSYIEEKIKSAGILLGKGVKKTETEKTLAEWKQMRANAIAARKSIENTWSDVWGIWGLEKVKIEMPVDLKEGEETEDFLLVVTPQPEEHAEQDAEAEVTDKGFGGEDEDENKDEYEIDW